MTTSGYVTSHSVDTADHRCLLYADSKMMLSQAASYLAAGLRRGERCTYVVDDHEVDDVLAALAAAGIAVDRERRQGALRLLDAGDCARSGPLDPAAVVRRLRGLAREATADGFAGSRMAVEMTWTLTAGIGHDRMLEYEALGDAAVFSAGCLTGLCMYNRHRFPSGILEQVLRRHPSAVVDGDVVPNAYYEPPGHSGADCDEARLDGMLARLRDAYPGIGPGGESVALRQLTTLAEATSGLSSPLEPDEVLQRVAAVAVPRLADRCTAGLVDGSGRLRTVARACADVGENAPRDRLEHGTDEPRDPDDPVARVVRSGRPMLLADVPQRTLEPPAPAQAGIRREADDLTVCSALIVPVKRGARVIGVISLLADGPGSRYDRADLRLAEQIARCAALALENARLHRDVEQASRAKSAFLSRMSHDVRTPLTAIMGYTELLKSEAAGPLTSKQREHAARVQSSAWHLSSLLDDILAYSRLAGRRERVIPGPVDPAEIARHAAEVAAPLAREKGIGFRSCIPDLPDRLRTDGPKLRQILVNLLGNAARFASEGEIVLELAEDGADVVFRVVDTGIGIAPENHERIFLPFVQLEERRADTLSRGAGLGLTISRRLARLLGGDIEVDSALDAGSTFTLRLPVDAPARRDRADSRPPSTP